MKKGDLVRYHKKEVCISEEGMPTWIERIVTGVVVTDYDKYIKIISVFAEGRIQRIHISDVSLLKKNKHIKPTGL
jgi:hypothetical protein|tara:strand:+ start:431 stop:655 length:225 start_codon:yes stop_codon:yes gene_type:complete